jgi:hypothetical protein
LLVTKLRQVETTFPHSLTKHPYRAHAVVFFIHDVDVGFFLNNEYLLVLTGLFCAVFKLFAFLAGELLRYWWLGKQEL